MHTTFFDRLSYPSRKIISEKIHFPNLICKQSFPGANSGRKPEFDGRAQVGPTYPTKF